MDENTRAIVAAQLVATVAGHAGAWDEQEAVTMFGRISALLRDAEKASAEEESGPDFSQPLNISNNGVVTRL
jgi:hypothetical protein